MVKRTSPECCQVTTAKEKHQNRVEGSHPGLVMQCLRRHCQLRNHPSCRRIRQAECLLALATCVDLAARRKRR